MNSVQKKRSFDDLEIADESYSTVDSVKKPKLFEESEHSRGKGFDKRYVPAAFQDAITNRAVLRGYAKVYYEWYRLQQGEGIDDVSYDCHKIERYFLFMKEHPDLVALKRKQLTDLAKMMEEHYKNVLLPFWEDVQKQVSNLCLWHQSRKSIRRMIDSGHFHFILYHYYFLNVFEWLHLESSFLEKERPMVIREIWGESDDSCSTVESVQSVSSTRAYPLVDVKIKNTKWYVPVAFQDIVTNLKGLSGLAKVNYVLFRIYEDRRLNVADDRYNIVRHYFRFMEEYPDAVAAKKNNFPVLAELMEEHYSKVLLPLWEDCQKQNRRMGWTYSGQFHFIVYHYHFLNVFKSHLLDVDKLRPMVIREIWEE